MALEEAVEKSLANPVRNAAPGIASRKLQLMSYASVLPLQMTKTAVRIRIDGADNLQPQELLSKAKEYIKGAHVIRQMRSNDTEVFVQSAFQRDAALNMRQPNEFKILRQDLAVELSGIPLRTRIEGGDAENNATISEIETASEARIPCLKIDRIQWLHDGKKH